MTSVQTNPVTMGNLALQPVNINCYSRAPKLPDKISEIEIRQALTTDTLALNALFNHLDRETPYLGFMPGERSAPFWDALRIILEDSSGSNGIIFVAQHGKEAVGYLHAEICPLQRLRHSLTIEVGIRQSFTGHGIGRRLFEAIEQWAKARQIHRLALTVATDNERALALYKKCGFVIEGVLHHAMVHEGRYIDDYMMAKLLT